MDRVPLKTLHRKGLADLHDVAAVLVAELRKTPIFVLWLHGPVGAGKTALVREVLYQIGLPRSQPVTSPTFTYFNEYKIDGDFFYHCDFYRDLGTLRWDETGTEWPTSGGFFVEWASEGGMTIELEPTHILEIQYGEMDSSRDYTLFRAIMRGR